MPVGFDAGSVVVRIVGEPKQLHSTFQTVHTEIAGIQRQIKATNKQMAQLGTFQAQFGTGASARSIHMQGVEKDLDRLIKKAKATQRALRPDVDDTLLRALRHDAIEAEVAMAGLAKTSYMTGGAVQTLGGRSNVAAVAVTQVGFAVEDFLTVVGTSGLAGGLRAAGNNMSFLASTISPVAGLLVGVGTALGAFVIPRLWEMATATAEANKNQIEFHERMRQSGITFREMSNAIKRDAEDLDMFDPLGIFSRGKSEKERQKLELEQMLKERKRIIGRAAEDQENLLRDVKLSVPSEQDLRALGVDDVTEVQAVRGTGPGGFEQRIVVKRSVRELRNEMAAAAAQAQKLAKEAAATGSPEARRGFTRAVEDVQRLAKEAADLAKSDKIEEFLPKGFDEATDKAAELVRESAKARGEMEKIEDALGRVKGGHTVDIRINLHGISGTAFGSADHLSKLLGQMEGQGFDPDNPLGRRRPEEQSSVRKSRPRERTLPRRIFTGGQRPIGFEGADERLRETIARDRASKRGPLFFGMQDVLPPSLVPNSFGAEHQFQQGRLPIPTINKTVSSEFAERKRIEQQARDIRSGRFFPNTLRAEPLTPEQEDFIRVPFRHSRLEDRRNSPPPPLTQPEADRLSQQFPRLEAVLQKLVDLEQAKVDKRSEDVLSLDLD